MLEVLCESHAIIGEMGLLATCHDRVSACLVKIEQFLDKCYDGSVRALLSRSAEVRTYPDHANAYNENSLPRHSITTREARCVRAHAIQQGRVKLRGEVLSLRPQDEVVYMGRNPSLFLRGR